MGGKIFIVGDRELERYFGNLRVHNLRVKRVIARHLEMKKESRDKLVT